MSTVKKLASQTAVYGVSQVIGRFANYLLVPLYTTIFNPGEYGVVTLLYACVTFFNVLLTYGMETAFFRFANREDDIRKVFSTSFTSVLVTSVLFVVISNSFTGKLAYWTRLESHPEYITWFIWIMALDAVAAIPFALLRQQNKPLKFALIRNINVFSNILLNLYFLIWCPYMQKSTGQMMPGYDPSLGIGYIFISNLVASVLTLPLLLTEIFYLRLSAFSTVIWRQMLIYALPMMVVGFAGMINETLDRALINWLYPDPETGRVMNGIYGANYKLSLLISLFIQAFRYAAEPFFFSHAKTDDSKSIYATVMDYFVLVCLFLFLTVTLFIGLFEHFIGPEFRAGLKVVPVLLLANMFLGIYYNLSIWYKLSDQTNKGALISLMGAGITILLNLWWIPVFGYLGAAWATFCCYLSMLLVCYVMGQKYYPIPYHVGKVLTYMLIAIALYFISRLIGMKVSGYPFHFINGILLLSFILSAGYFEMRTTFRKVFKI